MNKELEESPLLPLLIKFSIPATVAVLTNIVYNITDRYFIGQTIGRYGMSAISLIFPLILVVNGIGFMFSIGSGAFAGIKLGEKKLEEAKKIMGTTTLLVLIVGSIYSLFILLGLESILNFLGATNDNISYARNYAKFLFPATAFQMLLVVLSSSLRTEGSAKLAMNINVLGALLNILLDYTFIVKMGLEMKGAAIATALSATIPCLYLIYYCSRKAIIRLEIENIKICPDLLKRVVNIGVSGFYNQLLNGVMVFIMNKQLLSYGGDIALASVGIITTVRSFINTSFIGFNRGRQPIISYNYGAKKYNRVIETLFISLKIIIGISLILVILSMVFAKEVALFFVKDDPSLVEMTSWAIRRNLCMMVFTALYLGCANYFQGVGKGNITTRLLILRLLLLNIPLLLILPKFLGLLGVVIAFPISDFIASIAASIHIRNEVRGLRRLNKIKNI